MLPIIKVNDFETSRRGLSRNQIREPGAVATGS